MNNSFDDQLREKWEEKHFSVDDHHRNEMLALLETNRRKRGIFWWFGGLALAIAIGGAMLYLAKEDNSLPSEPVSPEPVEKNVEETSSSPKATADNSAIPATDIKHEATRTNALPKISNQGDEKNIISKNQSIHIKSQHVSKAIKKSKNQKAIESQPKQTTNVAVKENVFAVAPNVNNNEVIIIPNTSPAIVSKAVAVTVIPDDVEFMPADAPEHHYTYTPVPLKSIFFSDITSESELAFGIKPAFSLEHSFNVFAETGMGFIRGVKNKYVSGWDFNAGAGVGYRMGAKTSLLLSAGYLLQNGGFNFERTSTVTQQGFGIRSNFNTLQPDKLHFIYSRLGLQYEVKRNIFSIYAGMQYLYGAQGTIVVRTVDQFATIPESSHYAWLSTKGMQRILFNGELVYGYRITPRINLRAGVKYYFTSIEKEDPSLSEKGYYWNGQYSSFVPTFTINYHLYGKR